ncbi:hypothetical protein IA539_04890 [Gordonia sp. zg691]|uniref:hypothetical protein n=1 Tax=Gordonia jinghuaiqii TaxID=2758710 RepID=UPI0016628099|nr:hypothetical protein [Gordonia jinghuaiqii]MBD0860544.1 hypothetical protein [Gordonia jinghuaiqii]
MLMFPADRFGLLHRDAALRAGFSDEELSGSLARGELIRVIPGVGIAATDQPTGADSAEKRHRLRALATAASERADGHPLSHTSAAAVLGLPMLDPDLSLVHVTTGRTSGGSIRAQRHIHAAPLDPAEIVQIDGVRATSIERTAVDVAIMGTFAQALVVFDAALRLGADRETMSDLLSGRRRRSARNARRAMPFADAASESVGESWSRAQMIDAGLPLPTLQREFVLGGARYRSDFDWDELLVGEFDGLQKYGALVKPGETTADAVVREKLREDRLRAAGVVVVRWTWSTLRKGELDALLRPWLQKLGLLAA